MQASRSCGSSSGCSWRPTDRRSCSAGSEGEGSTERPRCSGRSATARGDRWALLGGSVELGAGLLLAGGLFTAIAATALIGQFLNVIVAVHLRNGVWNTKGGGFEFPLTLAIAIAMFALTGPGSWSIDHAIGWRFGGLGWFLTALLGGLLAGGLVLGSRRPVVATEQHRSAQGREAA